MTHNHFLFLRVQEAPGHGTATLWCQIRTARFLLGPVVPYPPWFFERGVFFHFLPLWFLLGPRFSVSA